jgi:hypothetical protein
MDFTQGEIESRRLRLIAFAGREGSPLIAGWWRTKIFCSCS